MSKANIVFSQKIAESCLWSQNSAHGNE